MKTHSCGSHWLKRLQMMFVVLAFTVPIQAEYTFSSGVQINLGAGSGDFAPYYLHANRFGKITQAINTQIDMWAADSLDLNKRFDFAWGVEALAGYTNSVDYRRYNPDTKEWFANPQRPAPIWLQQLYAEVKWRCLFLRVGLKDNPSAFVDRELSSGDLLWSGNSRSIPEARIGFVDFQNIPFTKKWVQFDVCLSYGKFVDTDWVNNHFDYYHGKRNPGPFWTYKRAALRSNPDKPFMFQLGIQMSAIFGGKTYYYWKGTLDRIVDNYNGFRDFIEILFPFWKASNDKEGYRVGDTKGTWDLAARYRFKGGESLRAYVQWPWEDSSGIYKGNGFDGLWGLEFKAGRRWWVTGAAVEYLDLTNMSGPIAYVPYYTHGDNDKRIPYQTNGRDAYYNNFYYRAYTNYGLNMGTPMVQGTLFYTGDISHILENGSLPYFRVRAIHLALEGAIGANCDYIVKYNHRKAWGDTNSYALIHPVEADSFIAGATYRIPKIPGFSLAGYIGVDHGSMPQNAFGAMISLTYEKNWTIGH